MPRIRQNPNRFNARITTLGKRSHSDSHSLTLPEINHHKRYAENDATNNF
ncbi:MAG: hypothetical protein SAK29_16450 [Scytonema sp. PMC 1069.18]|nr:hypothetical protein [Scytonema sp. PMC 1069.18]MEC4885856.1 hypothetical protein [Scytonema sp. PMC 1070.18]